MVSLIEYRPPIFPARPALGRTATQRPLPPTSVGCQQGEQEQEDEGWFFVLGTFIVCGGLIGGLISSLAKSG